MLMQLQFRYFTLLTSFGFAFWWSGFSPPYSFFHGYKCTFLLLYPGFWYGNLVCVVCETWLADIGRSTCSATIPWWTDILIVMVHQTWGEGRIPRGARGVRTLFLLITGCHYGTWSPSLPLAPSTHYNVVASETNVVASETIKTNLPSEQVDFYRKTRQHKLSYTMRSHIFTANPKARCHWHNPPIQVITKSKHGCSCRVCSSHGTCCVADLLLWRKSQSKIQFKVWISKKLGSVYIYKGNHMKPKTRYHFGLRSVMFCPLLTLNNWSPCWDEAVRDVTSTVIG